jgi:hypothetical protein
MRLKFNTSLEDDAGISDPADLKIIPMAIITFSVMILTQISPTESIFGHFLEL